METLDVKKILRDHLEWLRWALQLQDWEITTSVEAVDAGSAECIWQPNYMRCHITFDPGDHSTEKEVLEALVHELSHGLIIQHLVFRDVVNELITDSVTRSAVRAVWTNATEVSVERIKRMLVSGLGLGPKELIARAKKQAKRKDTLPTK